MLVAKTIPLLSRRACFHLANLFGALMSIFDRRGRAVALANLEVAFGSTMSILQRKKIARESFQHFARTMLDLFWSSRLNAQNFSRYIDISEAEFLELTGIGPNEPFIMGCYHYSNFEWLSLAGGFVNYPASIIAQNFKNPLLDPFFKQLREQSGHTMVPREGAVVRLYKALRRGGRVALLIDLTVPPDVGSVVIDCFGLKTSVTVAHAWLHKKIGVPIVPAHCEPLPNGRYRVVFHRKIDNVQSLTLAQIAQACWDEFEPHVREHPAPWLWMYKHWRYRPRDAQAETYPFYAHVSPPFERLLRAQAQDAIVER
ncbi:MAG: Kdo2-lipid lauroyltransferase/acyltransferase [Verrucomicrobiota bacterium]